jgi:hypothetical protein
VGFSLRRMFRNPFGKKSLFHKATQIASLLPIPGAGLIGKAMGFANRARAGYDALSGRVNPILTAAGARPLVPSQAPLGVMPGGAKTSGARGRPTQSRSSYRRKARSTRRRPVRRRTTKRRRR